MLDQMGFIRGLAPSPRGTSYPFWMQDRSRGLKMIIPVKKSGFYLKHFGPLSYQYVISDFSINT